MGWKQAAVLAAEGRAQQAGAPPKLKPSKPAVAELSLPHVHIWISRTDLRRGCCLHCPALLSPGAVGLRCCHPMLSPSLATGLSCSAAPWHRNTCFPQWRHTKGHSPTGCPMWEVSSHRRLLLKDCLKELTSCRTTVCLSLFLQICLNLVRSC